MRLKILLLFNAVLAVGCLSSCSSSSNKIENHEDPEEEHHHSGVDVSEEMAKEFGIEFETVEPKEFHHIIKASGVVEASGADVASVVARKSGIITLSSGISEGVEVKSGERIASISSDVIQGGDVSKAASANLQVAKSEYERLKPLYEDGLVTASAFREAEKAYREAEALAGKTSSAGSANIVATIAGSINRLSVKTGEFVDAGATIATIIRNSTQILKADLPVRESGHLGEIISANFIPEGKDDVIKLSDFNGKKISGNSSNVENGYIPVYFSFQGNPLSSPGGFAEVFLICEPVSNIISVPREALLEIQGNKYVYVGHDEDSFEKRIVKTGASDGERIEITEGLEKGETIVSKGASVVRMAEVSAVAPPAHNHNH